MGAAFSEDESKFKRTKLFRNSHDRSDTASPPFAYSVWENLPYVALVEIYRYLPPKDKFKLSLTCKAWNQPFYRPEIWPKATFQFNGKDDWRALSFNDTLSSGLRHLYIDCQDRSTKRSLKRYTALESTTNLYTFIESLVNNKNCRLLTLKLTNMARLTWWFNESSQRDVVKILEDLLSTQTILQIVDLSDAGLNAMQGIDILSTMAHTCGSTITELTINNLFRDFVPICMATQLGAFTKLTELSLDNENLTDKLLNALSTSGSLMRMNVTARSCTTFNQTSSESWEHLKRSCPALEAHYLIDKNVGNTGLLISILTPGIPLVALEFSWKDLYTLWKYTCVHIAVFFQKYLRQLKIVLRTEPDRPAYFQIIVDRCLLLEEISIKNTYWRTSCLELETSIGSSVRRALARQPASRLRKFTLNGVDVNLKRTWKDCLVDVMIGSID